MAGMPQTLLNRATEIMNILEEKHGSKANVNEALKSVPKLPNYQLNIFDGVTDDLRHVQLLLEETDINTLTPVEALLKLNELKSIVKQYA